MIGYEDALGLLFIISGLALIFLGLGWLLKQRSKDTDDDSDSDDPPGGDDYNGPSFSFTPLSKETKVFECGHTGPMDFTFKIFGVESEPVTDAEPCPECFEKEFLPLVARCSRCGKAIFPGDPVALYHTGNRGLHLRISTYADDLHVVGCLDMDCCPISGFFAGYWTEKGFESSFGTGATFAEEVLKTGQSIQVKL